MIPTVEPVASPQPTVGAVYVVVAEVPDMYTVLIRHRASGVVVALKHSASGVTTPVKLS